MALEDLATEICQVRNKIEKLNHYIRYVDRRLDSLMEDIWDSEDEQVQAIGRRLVGAQEETKATYRFVENAFFDDAMGTSMSGAVVEFPKFILEDLEVKEDYLCQLVNYFICKFETEGNNNREEEEKDGEWESIVEWFGLHSLRDISASEDEYFLGRRANTGIFKGINVSELLQETSELIQERDQSLRGNPIVLLNNTVMDEEKDGRCLDQTLVIRGSVYEKCLCDIFVFLVLFVGKNECHKEAFQEFKSQLKGRSSKRTRLINKLLNLLEGAKFKLERMKNLTKLTGNILDRFSSARIEERKFVMFLEVLLDGIEHLDIILQDVPVLPPTSVVDEFSASEDVVQRGEDTMNLIWNEVALFRRVYDRWEYEVFMLVNSVSFEFYSETF